MEKVSVEQIFKRLINFSYKKTISEYPMSNMPELELVHELYDIYHSKPKFDIYINTFTDDDETNEVFNSNLRESCRLLQLVQSFNYRIFYNTNIPERFDELMSASEELKTELENYLTGYDSKDSYFKVVFVGPENTNWLPYDIMSARIIVELHTNDPNDDDLRKAAIKTLEIVLNRMIKKYPMFEGYSYYLDIIEMDSEELPYDEEINENHRVRVFSEGVDDEDLKWHRDREDRLIEVIDGEGWELQFDNELPKKLTPGTKILIPEGVYHRIIKGNGDLKVSVQFI